MSVVASDDGRDPSAGAAGREPSEYSMTRGENEGDIQSVLRILAETQRMMLNNTTNGGNFNRQRVLATVKLAPFDGAHSTTQHAYK